VLVAVKSRNFQVLTQGVDLQLLFGVSQIKSYPIDELNFSRYEQSRYFCVCFSWGSMDGFVLHL